MLQPSHSPGAAAAASHVACGKRPAVLATIGSPHVNLALWTRRLAPPVAQFARGCRDGDLHARFEAPAVDVAAALDAEAIPTEVSRDAAGRAAWIADAASLAARFARVVGVTRVRVHVEVVARDACRLFHVDSLPCRLITTYAGRGTEWLADGDVVRAALGRGDNDAVRRPAARIQRLQAGWVGLFKGDGPARPGIVHRSPPIAGTGARRLVLKVDVPGIIAC